MKRFYLAMTVIERRIKNGNLPMSHVRVPKIERFFPAHPAVRARFDREARKFPVDTSDRDALEAWRSEVRKHLMSITGIDTMHATDPRPVVTESVVCDGYTRSRIEIYTEPDVVMPFYALVPDDMKSGERRPVVIAPHGHGSGGKNLTVGRSDIPAVAEAMSKFNADYAHRFAMAGLVVFGPDARAFGERREPVGQMDDEESFMTSTCTPLNHAAIALGQSLTGMWTWDLMRLLDYALSRDDCDSSRIGCAGLSGGGLQTLWLAALDDRVSAAVVSGYFYGYRDSLLDMNANCGCNYVPGLWQAVDMGDLGAMVAPRPLFIETGSRDPLNGARGLPNVLEQVRISQAAYDVCGASSNLIHDVCEGEHEWFGVMAEPWLQEQLGWS